MKIVGSDGFGCLLLSPCKAEYFPPSHVSLKDPQVFIYWLIQKILM